MWPLSQRTPWVFSSWCDGGSSCRWDGSLSSCSLPGSWQVGGSAYSRAASPTLKTIYVLPAGPPRQRGRRGGWPVGAAGSSRVAKQLPARLGVERSTLKTLMIGLGTLVLLALTRPALAQRCLSFRAPAFFAGAAVAPGYPYPAYGYPCTHTRFPGVEPRLRPGRHLRARVRRAGREHHQLHVPRPR